MMVFSPHSVLVAIHHLFVAVLPCHFYIKPFHSHSTVHNCDKFQRRFSANFYILPNILRIFWPMINESARMWQQSALLNMHCICVAALKLMKKDFKWNGIPHSLECSSFNAIHIWFVSLRWTSVSGKRILFFNIIRKFPRSPSID